MSGIMESSKYFDLAETEKRIQTRVMFAPSFFTTIENMEVSRTLSLSPANDEVGMYTGWVVTHAATERKMMTKALLKYDLNDLAIMIGTGSFVGSTAGVLWSSVFSTPASPSFIIPASLIGLIAGRLLSEKSKRRVNGH